ncbi:hypothetical protein KC19_6G095300 [Ceratodon purpureus]|uniref:Uncharacterized protein n=1 Tax=Ceratodon purpureus TaxID=3225 RepID=A0A8T0HIK7_CERPU|nr:hypothetical protein KC19_6G095300 [Ceratodon purpureus]
MQCYLMSPSQVACRNQYNTTRVFLDCVLLWGLEALVGLRHDIKCSRQGVESRLNVCDVKCCACRLRTWQTAPILTRRRRRGARKSWRRRLRLESWVEVSSATPGTITTRSMSPKRAERVSTSITTSTCEASTILLPCVQSDT